MKKIFLFFLLLSALISKAQFPITATTGNSSTLQKANGAYGGMLGYVFAGSYGDTTAANLSFIKNVPGIVIRTSDKLWLRNSTATKWLELLVNDGTFLDEDFAHDNLTASGNRVHNFNNNSLSIDSISFFTIKSSRSNGGLRYSMIDDTKPFYTGIGLHSQYDNANAAEVYVFNSNGNSQVYIPAYNNSSYSEISVLPGSITLKPNLGSLKIDSLAQGAGTYAMRWDRTTQTVTYADTTDGGGGTWGSITGTLSDQTDLQAELNAKEASFSETAEEFTSSTSMSITLSNTPKAGKAEMYYLNGIVIKSSNISRTGTSVTLSGFTRESSDVITAKYSY